MRKIAVYFFPIALLLLFHPDIYAKKVPGYIITHRSDTLKGIIRLRQNTPFTTAFVINKSVNLESFYSQVEFREISESRFITYTPEQIKEFGFQFNSQDFVFRSFVLNYKSLLKEDMLKPRFLNLMYDNGIQLYRDMVRMYIDTHLDYSGTKGVLVYNYYLNTPEKGLIKAEATEEFSSVHDILIYCGIESEFVNSLSDDADFQDIFIILQKYDEWKSFQTQDGYN